MEILSEVERNNRLQIIRLNEAIFFVVGISSMPLYITSTSQVALFWQYKYEASMIAIEDMTSKHRDSIICDILRHCTDTVSRDDRKRRVRRCSILP
jgi:hypothetical protein